MVGHLAERMHHPVEPQAGSTQNFQPVTPIDVVKENAFAPVTARGHVINGTGKLCREFTADVGMLDLTIFHYKGNEYANNILLNL